jgi:formate-dependent nitrite reductase membrane component NrfD
MEEKQLNLEEDAILFEPIRKRGKLLYHPLYPRGYHPLGVYAYINQYRQDLHHRTGRPIFGSLHHQFRLFHWNQSRRHSHFCHPRLAKAEWRRSITRSAEVITVLVLFFGVGNILMDLGRPDRMFNIIQYAQFKSPLLWDVSSISVYLTASSIYLYLPLIPDIALLRDHGGKWQWFYRIFALGWNGTERQHHLLEKGIAFMAILVIPVAISVHTVVSFVFAMTIQPMWHSAIFGPYFVAGAIFSGIAALIVAMNLIRKVYHLEDYLRPVHFNNLGILLLVMTLLWFYFTFTEHLTVYWRVFSIWQFSGLNLPEGSLLTSGDCSFSVSSSPCPFSVSQKPVRPKVPCSLRSLSLSVCGWSDM